MSEKKKMSLLKPYTHFDKIKNMNIDELADFIEEINACCCSAICITCQSECEYSNLNFEERVEYCHQNIKQWLESEVTE